MYEIQPYLAANHNKVNNNMYKYTLQKQSKHRNASRTCW